MKLSDNFEEILAAFNKHGVNYLIAGGYAVIFHGYGRTTGDLDIWVKPSEENKKKIIAAFNMLGYPTELEKHLQKADFTKPFAVKLGKEPLEVDVFTAITGVKYEDAELKSIPYKFSSKLDARFIHLHDLLVNKMLTGRMKDKADVEELHRINTYSKEKGIIAMLKKLFNK